MQFGMDCPNLGGAIVDDARIERDDGDEDRQEVPPYNSLFRRKHRAGFQWKLAFQSSTI
jgi:hypothetical protein